MFMFFLQNYKVRVLAQQLLIISYIKEAQTCSFFLLLCSQHKDRKKGQWWNFGTVIIPKRQFNIEKFK